MGLDNGVVFKVITTDGRKSKKIMQQLHTIFPSGSDFMVPFYDTTKNENGEMVETGEVEVAYWRKFWGLRRMFLWTLPRLDEKGEETNEDSSRLLVDKNVIKDLIVIARQFLDEEYFEENGDQPIWDYDEYIDTMKFQIEQLEKLDVLFRWLKSNGYKPFVDYTCYFYDSY